MTDHDALLQLAREISARAYAPYSKAHVGCALISAAGHLYRGCNVENASYGLTICAERSAVFAGVAAEGSGFRIAQLAVIAPGFAFPPCGACRQVIAEFADGDCEIAFPDSAGRLQIMRLEALLPAAFSPNALASESK